jgi:hypothetical protein
MQITLSVEQIAFADAVAHRRDTAARDRNALRTPSYTGGIFDAATDDRDGAYGQLAASLLLNRTWVNADKQDFSEGTPTIDGVVVRSTRHRCGYLPIPLDIDKRLLEFPWVLAVVANMPTVRLIGYVIGKEASGLSRVKGAGRAPFYGVEQIWLRSADELVIR